MSANHPSILKDIESVFEDKSDFNRAVLSTMQILHDRKDGYDWIGVYWLQRDELHLGPYVGKPTDHVKIPVGKGVCGTAVAEDRNQVIDDVRELNNYIACSIETRSEIVVLIRGTDGEILGQIDADGHKKGNFTPDDERLLEDVAALIAKAKP